MNKIQFHTGSFYIDRHQKQYILKDNTRNVQYNLDEQNYHWLHKGKKGINLRERFSKNRKSKRNQNPFILKNGQRYEVKYLDRYIDDQNNKLIYFEYQKEGNRDDIISQYIPDNEYITMLPDNVILTNFKIQKIDNFAIKFWKAAIVELNKDKLSFKTPKNAFIYGQIEKEKQLLQAIQKRQQKRLQNLTTKSDTFTLTNNWRFIVGLGNESVYENGMTLHHTYGIPYIPGSGIKGMLRNWIVQECFDDETQASKNKLFQAIFGYGSDDKDGGAKGKVVFWDAFPTEKFTIEPDVINSHYQDYYRDASGKTPPADWLSPNPVFFYSVKGGKYQFAFAINPRMKEEAMEEKEYLPFQTITNETQIKSLVKELLLDALQYSGIGAKTAIGYGKMI